MQAWQNFLQTLKQDLGEEAFNLWLSPLKVVHFDACNLYLEAFDSFQLDWFEEHVRARAKKEFVNQNMHPIKIHLTCPSLPLAPSKGKKEKESQLPIKTFSLIQDPLFPEYQFDQFIFSSSNQMIHKLVETFSNHPLEETAKLFNPIFFYAGACCGKTHLLQAFAHLLQAQGKRVLYTRAETFTENVVGAIRSGHMQEFRIAHRHVDVFLLDGIQYLAKKTATQEEFFHTFNTLHAEKKMILLSADTPSCQLQEIEPRLISRFEWGLSLPIHKLQPQEIPLLIAKRAKQLSLSLPSPTVQFLIETFADNIKTLQTSLEALALRAPIGKGKPISPTVAADLLKDLLEQKQQKAFTPYHFIDYVADFYKISPQDIVSKTQTQEITEARQLAMFLCRTELKMPFTKIGAHFQRDHSTVISSVKNIEEKTRQQDKLIVSALLYIHKKMDQIS